jgi:hypothetical protein
MIDDNGKYYENCLVGNIIDKHYWGEDKQIQKGTKQFRPGTKVYCMFNLNTEQHVTVFGKPRKSFKMINIIIDTNYVKNFRMQKVYIPQVLEFISDIGHNYDYDEESLNTLNKMNVEIDEASLNNNL